MSYKPGKWTMQDGFVKIDFLRALRHLRIIDEIRNGKRPSLGPRKA